MGSARDLPTGAQMPIADCPDPVLGYYDADGDGHGDPLMPVELCGDVDGFVAAADDCDDLRAEVSPAAADACGDGLDADCDGIDPACAPADLVADAWALSWTGGGELGPYVTAPVDFGAGLEAIWGVPDFGADQGLALRVPAAGAAGTSGDLSASVAGDLSPTAAFELGRALTPLPAGALAGGFAAGGAGGVLGPDLNPRGGAVLLVEGAFGAGAGDAAIARTLWAPGSVSTQGVVALAATPDGGTLAATEADARVWLISLDLATDGAELANISVRVEVGGPTEPGASLVYAEVDGDGLPDLFLGDTGLGASGGVWVALGDDLAGYGAGVDPVLGDVGRAVTGDDLDRGLGHALAAVDLDGDGVDEVAVGGLREPGAGQPGSAQLLSLGDAAALPLGAATDAVDLTGDNRALDLWGDQFDDLFAFALAPVLDPAPALALGAPRRSSVAADPGGAHGALWVLPGAPGLLDAGRLDLTADTARLSPGPIAGDAVGVGLARAGDVDGDAADELWAGSYGIGTGEPRALLLLQTGL
jgi:hypothetical protein